MLFIYVLSLCYLTQLVLSQTVSDEQQINKIISELLLKVEKKNVMPQQFSWNNDVTRRSLTSEQKNDETTKNYLDSKVTNEYMANKQKKIEPKQFSWTDKVMIGDEVSDKNYDKYPIKHIVLDLSPEPFFLKEPVTSSTLSLLKIVEEFNNIYSQNKDGNDDNIMRNTKSTTEGREDMLLSDLINRAEVKTSQQTTKQEDDSNLSTTAASIERMTKLKKIRHNEAFFANPLRESVSQSLSKITQSIKSHLWTNKPTKETTTYFTKTIIGKQKTKTKEKNTTPFSTLEKTSTTPISTTKKTSATPFRSTEKTSATPFSTTKKTSTTAPRNDKKQDQDYKDKHKYYVYDSSTNSINGGVSVKYALSKITEKEMYDLKDIENEFNSIPKYAPIKTTELLDDYMDRIIKYKQNKVLDNEAKTSTKQATVEYVKDVAEKRTPDTALSDFLLPTTPMKTSNKDEISQENEFETKEPVSDMYLLVNNKNKEIKAVFTIESNKSKNETTETSFDSDKTIIIDNKNITLITNPAKAHEIEYHAQKTPTKQDLDDLYKEVIEMYGNIKGVPSQQLEKKPKIKKIGETIKEVSWDRIKKLFGHDRVCNCKCRANKTLCRVCSATDSVIRELQFEFNNLADYMNDHCTEIQSYFWMNPSGGKKLRDTVHRIDKTMHDYYKRIQGKCTGRTCKTFGTYLDKRQNQKKKRVNQMKMRELLKDIGISEIK